MIIISSLRLEIHLQAFYSPYVNLFVSSIMNKHKEPSKAAQSIIIRLSTNEMSNLLLFDIK